VVDFALIFTRTANPPHCKLENLSTASCCKKSSMAIAVLPHSQEENGWKREGERWKKEEKRWWEGRDIATRGDGEGKGKETGRDIILKVYNVLIWHKERGKAKRSEGNLFHQTLFRFMSYLCSPVDKPGGNTASNVIIVAHKCYNSTQVLYGYVKMINNETMTTKINPLTEIIAAH